MGNRTPAQSRARETGMVKIGVRSAGTLCVAYVIAALAFTALVAGLGPRLQNLSTVLN